MNFEQRKKTAVVVPHTHWDREWYLPFQVFRRRLAALVDSLIDLLNGSPEYRCFVLDGQTIVIGDYLELRPEREAAFRALTEAGRLLVGPWHVLPDEFLVSGESLIRNLELGHRIARRYGGAMKVGYVPDPFGHVGQLPQILRGFGIASAVFTRGAGGHPALEKSAFRWKSPSGHEALAIHQVTDGYGNFAHPPDDPDALVTMTRELLERDEKRNPFPIFLLCNGTDHLTPDSALTEKIRILNERIEGVKFVHGDFPAFLRLAAEQTSPLDEYTGELRGSRFHSLLPGVLSARMYIKQENAATQTALAGRAEPLAAAAALLTGAPFPAPELEAAWRLLIQNHPHDSICGCSVDQVHREMMPRFHQARQIAESVVADAAAAIAGAQLDDDRLKIVVFNTTCREVTDACELRLPLCAETAPLLDGNWAAVSGEESVPAEIEKAGPMNVFSNAPFHSRENVAIRFTAHPPFGWKTYSLKKTAPQAPPAPPARELSLSEKTIENEYLSVNVEANGSLTVRHKETGVVYSGLNLFEDEGDRGDEYDFSPAGKNTSTKNARARVEPLMNTRVTAALRVHVPLRLPDGLSENGTLRSNKKIPCPLTVDVFLHAGVPRVDIRVEIENNAGDHRLRAVFPTPFDADTATADSAFELVARPTRPVRGDDWHQKPYNTHPMQSFFDVPGGAAGLAILARGLPEYEVRHGRSGATGFLTLLRCVGALSRVALPERPEQAGPDLATPEGQCIGKHIFEYSIYPHGAPAAKNAPFIQAAAFNNPPLAVAVGKLLGAPAIAVDGPATGGLIIRELGKTLGGRLPESGWLVKIEPAALSVTALRMKEDGKLEVRFFNTSREPLEASVETVLPMESVEKVNFLGEPEGRQPRIEGSNSATLAIGPAEIVTLHFCFSASTA